MLRPHRLFSHPYGVPAEPFEVATEDDVILRGHRLGDGPDALVLCHGFTGWHRRPRQVLFQEALSSRFQVYAFDFRGHGASAGRSTMGARECLDVEAVVRLARQQGNRRVVTLGGSMGGIAVIRHAALVGGIDAVVAVSTPGSWDGHDTDAVRKALWLTGTRSGRGTLRFAGVRVVSSWEWAEAPIDVVERIAPIPLLIVHGRDDHWFDEEEGWALYRRARHPKRLMMAGRFGHAEDGYTPAFAGQIEAAVLEMLSPPTELQPPAEEPLIALDGAIVLSGSSESSGAQSRAVASSGAPRRSSPR